MGCSVIQINVNCVLKRVRYLKIISHFVIHNLPVMLFISMTVKLTTIKFTFQKGQWEWHTQQFCFLRA